MINRLLYKPADEVDVYHHALSQHREYRWLFRLIARMFR